MEQQAFGTFVMDISKPQRCWVHVEQVGDELVLRSRAQLFTAAGWLALFLLLQALLLLTALWVAPFAHARRAPTLGDILYNIFVIAMFIPVACVVLWWFLGTERLRIGPDGLDYQSRALIPLQERHVPLGEIKGIDYSLKIETLGKPVRFWGDIFWGDIEPRERRWLADLLQRHLQALVPDRVITLRPPDMGAVTKLTVPIEVLGPAGATPEPPPDCAIRLYSDGDRVEFVRRRASSLVSYGFTSLYLILSYGNMSICYILSILILLGWFGMFGLFGDLLEHTHSGFLLCFLSSFWVTRGCCLLLTIPFWVERWAMRPGEITARFSIFFGLGRPQRIEAKSVDRVELRKNAGIRKWFASHQEQQGDAPYSLGLVGRKGQDLLIIDALTEGEARWVVGQMCELLKGSLPRAGKKSVPPSRASDPLWDRELDR